MTGWPSLGVAAQCTLAYWHRPRWKDNGGTNGNSSYFLEELNWRFVSEAGRTFTDSGTHPCH